MQARDGLWCLYNGLGAKSTEAACKNFVYFFAYELLFKAVKRRNIKISTAINLLIGYWAGILNMCCRRGRNKRPFRFGRAGVYPKNRYCHIRKIGLALTLYQLSCGAEVPLVVSVSDFDFLPTHFLSVTDNHYFPLPLGTMPLEMIATRMQVAPLSFTEAISAIFTEMGFGGFYTGFGMNSLLCTNPAIVNTVFDIIKIRTVRTREKGLQFLTPTEAFMLGAFAKCVATILTYPLVKLKTTLQTGAAEEDKKNTAGESRLQYYFRGLGPALVRRMILQKSSWDEV